jgi:hypothetical protein
MTKTSEAGKTSMEKERQLLEYRPSMTLDELEKEIDEILKCIDDLRANGSLVMHNYNNSGSEQTIHSDYKYENRIVGNNLNIPTVKTLVQLSFDEAMHLP